MGSIPIISTKREAGEAVGFPLLLFLPSLSKSDPRKCRKAFVPAGEYAIIPHKRNSTARLGSIPIISTIMIRGNQKVAPYHNAAIFCN